MTIPRHTSPVVTFGTTTLASESIQNAIVTEDVNPVSTTVPFGTFELTLYSEEVGFIMIDPTGDYELLKKKQPIVVSIDVDGQLKLIGLYYLENWENVSDTLIKLSCIDLLGAINELTYDGGIWLTPIAVGDLIKSMFDPIGVSYSIDPDLATIELTGWIPICNYREALQQVMFAAMGYATCARQNGFIKMGKSFLKGVLSRGVNCGVFGCGQSHMWQQRWRQSTWGDLVPETIITKAEKGSNQKLTLNKLVTGVEVTTHDISEGTGSRKLFEGILNIGDYKIIFSQPMHTLSATGATVTSNGANYAWLNVIADDTSVILSGLVYVDSQKKVGVYLDPPEPDVKSNIIPVPNATLVSSTNGLAVTQNLYDYYEQRYLQKVRLYAPVAVTGNVVLIDTLYARQIRGTVEKMVLDLARGYTVQAEIVGSVEPI
jgi:hypothetical protein